MTGASLLGNCRQEQRHSRNSNHLAFERLERMLERGTSLSSLAFGRAYPITCKIVNLAHVVGSVDLLRGQAFEVLTVTWVWGYQPGMLLGMLQGSSGLLTLEQFFPPGGLEGPPRRSSQGGGLNKHIWNFPLDLGLGNRIKDDSPRGISFPQKRYLFIHVGIPRGGITSRRKRYLFIHVGIPLGGKALRESSTILVESVFHWAKDAKYK